MKNNNPFRSVERSAAELRPVSFTPNYILYPEGSVLIKMGNTHVLCNATIEETVPDWMKGKGKGWITAEYAMLPRATHTRSKRETNGPSSRSQEIKRLIGRSLRAAFDLNALGERTIILDCDVLQADGGTRTASITGGYVAVAMALKKLITNGTLSPQVIRTAVAAVSVGLYEGTPYLDLCYQEDSRADVDMNIVMNARGEFIELQGTAEGSAFTRLQMNQMLDLAEAGIKELLQHQINALEITTF
ncbi:MAG: ribonuclease PH [Anaerolineaceae bacterium]|nr:ribonuclease PH [Anaerolineaceae bacterium]